MGNSISTLVNNSTVNSAGRDHYIINYIFGHEPPPRPSNHAPVGRLSTHFIGRDREIDFLRNALGQAENGIPSSCAIYGMPGVGKSLLILHYAKSSFDCGKYSYIFWISATSVDKLHKGLTEVLDLVPHPDRRIQDQRTKLISARRLLQELPQTWLLIFDNVDSSTLGFLRTNLSLSNDRGHILFTTRTADVAEALVTMAGNQHPTLQLNPLELRDSTHLLFRGAGINMNTVTPSLLNHAEKLVESLGRLPLAITQAASYMKYTCTTLDEMHESYKGSDRIELIKWESDLTTYEERSIAKTFTKQFNQLKEESQEISNLLKFLSFLDPESIPIAMIIEGAKELLHPQPQSYPPEFHSLVAFIDSRAKFRMARAKLKDLCLIEDRSNFQSLWMHDLIRFIIQEAARKEETYREWLRSSISLVCGAFRHKRDLESPERWSECEKFIPHLRSLTERWSSAYGANPELVSANLRIVRYFESRARYKDAELLCKQVLESCETVLGHEDPNILTAMDTLGIVYLSQGRYCEAKAILDQALAGRERHLGANHEDTLTSKNNLGEVYFRQGRLAEAEALFELVLKIREGRLPADHRDTLISKSNLGEVYRQLERLDEAQALHTQALASRQQSLGDNHPDTLTSMANLAMIYMKQKRYDEAEPLQNLALERSRKHLGACHTITLGLKNNLACIYRYQGRLDKAKILYEQVKEDLAKYLGVDHPYAQTAEENLAILNKELGLRPCNL